MWKRVLVTATLIGVYRLAVLVPVPGLDPIRLSEYSTSGQPLSVFTLGFMPFVSAFVVIELLSFMFPGGRRLRSGGVAGRRRLDSYAVRLGIGLALFQSAGIGIALIRAGMVTAQPGIGTLCVLMIILTVGSTLAFLIAVTVSRWGLGNGFCLIIVISAFWAPFARLGDLAQTDSVFINLLELLAWIAAIGLVMHLYSRRNMVTLTDFQQRPISVTLPAFPQGLAPFFWAWGLIGLGSVAALVGATPWAWNSDYSLLSRWCL